MIRGEEAGSLRHENFAAHKLPLCRRLCCGVMTSDQRCVDIALPIYLCIWLIGASRRATGLLFKGSNIPENLDQSMSSNPQESTPSHPSQDTQTIDSSSESTSKKGFRSLLFLNVCSLLMEIRHLLFVVCNIAG